MTRSTGSKTAVRSRTAHTGSTYGDGFDVADQLGAFARFGVDFAYRLVCDGDDVTSDIVTASALPAAVDDGGGRDELIHLPGRRR
jgi:hypothetical protein